MSYLSQIDGHKIKDVYASTSHGLMKAIDMYSVKDGAPRKWVKDEDIVPPEIVSWADGTPEQIMALLNAHRKGLISLYETPGWEIGSTRYVLFSGVPRRKELSGKELRYDFDNPLKDQYLPMTLVNRGGKELEDGSECIFVVDAQSVLVQQDNVYVISGSGSYNTDSGLIPLAYRAVGASDSSKYEWESSPFRVEYLPVLYESVESGIRKIIKPCKNTTYNVTKKQFVTTIDKVWILSVSEILKGSSLYPWTYFPPDGEGEAFEYYKNDIKRASKLSPGNTEQIPNVTQTFEYWTRSATPQWDTTALFLSPKYNARTGRANPGRGAYAADGWRSWNNNGYSSLSVYGIAPAFCI